MLVARFPRFSPLVAIVLLSLGGISRADHTTEGGTSGGGGDKVEPLFVAARSKASSDLNRIEPNHIHQLNVPTFAKNWLMKGDNLSKLQFYVTAMELSFQEGPCWVDGSPRGTCFDNSDPQHPKMVISYAYNQNTTRLQAQALVIHEAGHFTGEKNHLFLSALGEALTANPAMRSTGLIKSKAGNIVQNPDGTISIEDPLFWHAGKKKWLRIVGQRQEDGEVEYDYPGAASGICAQLGYAYVTSYVVDFEEIWFDKDGGHNPRKVGYYGAGCVESAFLDSAGRYRGFSNCEYKFIRSIVCGRTPPELEVEDRPQSSSSWGTEY